MQYIYIMYYNFGIGRQLKWLSVNILDNLYSKSFILK